MPSRGQSTYPPPLPAPPTTHSLTLASIYEYFRTNRLRNIRKITIQNYCTHYPLRSEKAGYSCVGVCPCTASFYVIRVSAPRGLEAGHAGHADVALLSPGINKEGLSWAGVSTPCDSRLMCLLNLLRRPATTSSSSAAQRTFIKCNFEHFHYSLTPHTTCNTPQSPHTSHNTTASPPPQPGCGGDHWLAVQLQAGHSTGQL